MKPLYSIILLFACTFISCKSASSKVTDVQIKTLETLVESRNFKIESDWAHPLTTAAMQQVFNSGLLQIGSSPGAINLIGNPNWLTISGDSITSYLPYFGERQNNVGYGERNGAIELNSEIKDYKVAKGKRNSYVITCNANSKSENFNVVIELFPNLKSTIRMAGNSRNPISYSGRVEATN